MATADKQIPVRYVGQQAEWRDDLYNSLVEFRRGKASMTPAWAAALLLKHPEFEDARPKEERGLPIIATRRLLPVEVDREREELEAMEAHINLSVMTRDQMASYAMRTYGVHVDATALKADVAGAVKNLMRART